jgi:transposase
VLDNAGWHGPANLKIPDGIRLIYLPPYSPELQPAETLWALVDEPVVNKHIATIEDLDAKIAAQYSRKWRLSDGSEQRTNIERQSMIALELRTSNNGQDEFNNGQDELPLVRAALWMA